MIPNSEQVCLFGKYLDAVYGSGSYRAELHCCGVFDDQWDVPHAGVVVYDFAGHTLQWDFSAPGWQGFEAYLETSYYARPLRDTCLQYFRENCVAVSGRGYHALRDLFDIYLHYHIQPAYNVPSGIGEPIGNTLNIPPGDWTLIKVENNWGLLFG